jgi:hypothetical protein
VDGSRVHLACEEDRTVTALERFLIKVVESRGHTVLGLLPGKKHRKLAIRLSDGREVKVSIPGSPSCGERVSRDLLTMHLRRAERGMFGGSRDWD